MLINDQLKNLPATPGVYMYKDKHGHVLYVGKAKLLKARVRSYWAGPDGHKQANPDLDPAKQRMISQIASLETISTDNENEALILEANLIRKYQPPYNVVLRDDKYYLFIKITREDMPCVFITRKLGNDNARYFGPYSSAKSVRATLKLLRRIFPFKGAKDSLREIIFPHPLFAPDAKSFLNPAKGDTYTSNIQNIIRFLKGDRATIIAKLQEGMKKAAAAEHFEQASLFRDQLDALERLAGFQKVYLPTKESFDVISLARDKTMSAANIFQIRGGKLLNKHTFLLRHQITATPAATLRQFLLQYYSVAQDIPKTILLPQTVQDTQTLANWIKPAEPPMFLVPERGQKKQLVTMGAMNAQQLLSEQAAVFTTKDRLLKAHQELITALKLDPATTHRLETYDISNIQGTLATASMVVFHDGQAEPKQYRKFRMRLAGTPNDFAMMQETLRRRFGNHSDDAGALNSKARWPQPDLIIIDGGKGQLSSALKVLQELHLTIPIISLAKQAEEIFMPGQPESLRLPYDSEALYLMQRMRDEAHRFTIAYHRLLRSKEQRRSLLDEVPGIGPKTKQKLLAAFGGLKNIRAAQDEELAKILGETRTKLLRQYL